MTQAKRHWRVRASEASNGDWEIAAKLIQDIINRNALPPSPQSRARICEAIGRELALEYLSRANRKREARARMAIGLSPYRRTIRLEGCR
jgi:hypothetical protein